MRITDLPIDWRQRLTDASFREAVFQFHVDTGGKSSGRRLANHEFPKRNIGYSEDMGRKMRKWTVQGYIIISPRNTDYIPQRDALVRALEADGPGWLKLPTFEPELVMCESYSCEETRQKGGYVSFNMTFCERGKPIAADVQQATQSTVTTAATELSTATTTWVDSVIQVQGRGGAPGSALSLTAADAFMSSFN